MGMSKVSEIQMSEVISDIMAGMEVSYVKGFVYAEWEKYIQVLLATTRKLTNQD
jgi:hypothetical protein